MDNLFTKKVPLYFETDESQLVVGDSFKILTKMEPESVDMIFADPPYFLSNDGITCKGGKMVSVNKGSWDKLSESGTGVEEKHKFNRMVLCQDLVQVKMRNFSHFNPPEAQPQCVFFYTIVRIHLVTYSYNGYEFVSYCRKLPDIRKSSSMPACNREF